ncbi:MAG: histidine phosphatase family protein [Myxococcota bacterium]
MPEPTTLLLVRHGQTEWNAANRVQGQTNSDLTELGRAQAEAVAKLLDADAPAVRSWEARPTVLYASDLDRTQQTAAPISARLDLEPILDPRLREMHFGDLEGLTWPELEAKFPEVSMRLWGSATDPERPAPGEGGESRVDMHRRSRSALEEIAERHPGETVVVVSHGGVISFFIRSVLNVPFDARPSFSTANGSIAVARYKDEAFRLLSIGLTPAL